jgi:hypothetical protein
LIFHIRRARKASYDIIAVVESKGTLRETFFINMLSAMHNVSSPSKGDFLVDDKYTFEIETSRLPGVA